MKDINNCSKGYLAFVIVSVIVYLIFNWNYYESMGFYPFISAFQEFGIAFSLCLIFREILKILIHKFLSEKVKEKVFFYLTFNFINLFVLVLISHVLTACHFLDHLFFKIKDFLHLFNYGMNLELLYAICLIVFLSISLYFISKNKIVDKKCLVVASAIMFINLFYGFSYVIFLKHNSSIRETTLTNIVRNNVDILQCNKNTGLICEKISLDNIEQKNKDFKINDKVLEKNIKAVQKSLITTLKESNDDIVTYNSFNWCNILIAHKKYSVIAAYNKNTEMLVLDYSKSRMLLKIEDKKFKAITGLSTISWIILLSILILIHQYFTIKVKNKKIRGSIND